MTHFSKKKKQLYFRRKNYNPTVLQCDTCRRSYKLIFAHQASYCASTIVQDKTTQCIYSAYGSGYDTLKFIVSSNIKLKGNHICDKCITLLLDSKKIVQDETYDYWDAINTYTNSELKFLDM